MIKLLTISILFIFLTGNFSYGKEKGWFKFGETPTQVLDRVAEHVNKDKIQDNALNDISNTQGQYASEYKITNTLDALREQITPYIQWIMYIGLSLAVLLIIYNGLLMVTNGLHGEGDSEKVKTRIKNIAVGTGILTGFYVILQILLAIISYLFQ